ncbi:hypothetical protein KR059_000677, partial [Drosophila kikkawai]
NYKTTFISLGWSENSTIFDISKLKLKGREHTLNGTFDLSEDLDNEHYTFVGDMWNDVNGDGNYKLCPFEIRKDTVCKTYKSYRRYLKEMGEFGVTTNFPIHMDLCPIKKGHYYIKNVTINTNMWPTVVPRGFVRFTGHFYKDDVSVGSYFFIVLVENI